VEIKLTVNSATHSYEWFDNATEEMSKRVDSNVNIALGQFPNKKEAYADYVKFSVQRALDERYGAGEFEVAIA
jgi:hypothetical protein